MSFLIQKEEFPTTSSFSWIRPPNLPSLPHELLGTSRTQSSPLLHFQSLLLTPPSPSPPRPLFTNGEIIENCPLAHMSEHSAREMPPPPHCYYHIDCSPTAFIPGINFYFFWLSSQSSRATVLLRKAGGFQLSSSKPSKLSSLRVVCFQRRASVYLEVGWRGEASAARAGVRPLIDRRQVEIRQTLTII